MLNPVELSNLTLTSPSPSAERKDGVLYVNPGSAGPRRFSLPVSVARISIEGPSFNCEIVTLDV
jgi:predicted phosphodiesterase